MPKSIDDLKKLRDELALRRRKEIEEIASATDDARIDAAVRLHLAIEAIQKVIDEKPPFDPNRVMRPIR